MSRKKAYKISIFLSVLGLTLIYASSLYLGMEKVEVSEIDKSSAGKTLEISGEVTSSRKTSGHLFLDVNDSTGEILVVQFDSKKNIDEGEKVNVTGHVSIYKGTLEVIAKEIEKN